MADLMPGAVPTPPRRGWWVLLGALLIPLIYLPTLSTRFDFIDDGNLVYPSAPQPLADRAQLVWQKIVANYEDLGPFRPVLWVHWEIAADLLQGSEKAWRATRLVWCSFATLMLLWLFAELGLPPLAALVAGAIAMWNPYRNEIWTSLTLSEGVAMPYALLALVCARRAPGSRHAFAWDIGGACCVLAALGCKNTFAALVPAQMFLRLAPDKLPLREAWRRHGRRALLLGLTLLAPVAHFVYFKLHWHAGQYTTDGATLAQVRRILSGLFGAMSPELVGGGLGLAVLAMWRARVPWAALAQRYRAALGAGALLLLGGIVLYIPIGALSGRYSMPAVWGLDLALAVFLAGFVNLPSNGWTRAARVALALGLVGLIVASVGRQQKFAARARLLWQALEHVQREAPVNASVAWITGDSLRGGLDVEEGVHFQWHLAARGRRDIRIAFYGSQGLPLERRGWPPLRDRPQLALWAPPQASAAAEWLPERHFVAVAWGGWRRWECYVGRPADEAQAALGSAASNSTSTSGSTGLVK
jgi:hypothetical protein